MTPINALEMGISDADLEAYRDAANPMRHVKSIGAYEHTVVTQEIWGDKINKGDKFPWLKASEFTFRRGEVTLWHGINGHGKSALTSQFALTLAIQGRKSCIASFEMLPWRTIRRMIGQCSGSATPAENYIRQFFAALKDRIYIYDRRDRVDVKTLYAVIRYAALEKGCSHFFVDSLMKCVAGEDDYNGQKNFIGDLCNLARELPDMHIHVVHHVRKSDDENRAPSKFDAKGSGAITDQVDNVLAVWRNKQQEAERQLAESRNEVFIGDKPDFLVICDKQRNGGWEGRFGLFGDVKSWQFRDRKDTHWTTAMELPREPGQDESEAA